jgi:hypothetical protein
MAWLCAVKRIGFPGVTMLPGSDRRGRDLTVRIEPPRAAAAFSCAVKHPRPVRGAFAGQPHRPAPQDSLGCPGEDASVRPSKLIKTAGFNPRDQYTRWDLNL